MDERYASTPGFREFIEGLQVGRHVRFFDLPTNESGTRRNETFEVVDRVEASTDAPYGPHFFGAVWLRNSKQPHCRDNCQTFMNMLGWFKPFKHEFI